MNSKPKILSIDFETASEIDLRKTGVFPYARDTSTRVLCMAYAFDDGPVSVWRIGEPFPEAVRVHAFWGGRVQAWNAQFEYEIWNNTLGRQTGTPLAPLDRAQVYDSMAKGAYWGLPLGLDQAAEAAHIPHRKDKAGHALMMRMSRPRTKRTKDASATWWHETEPGKMIELEAYCAQDVEVERAVSNACPPLPDAEREIWLLDQKINATGVALDVPLISAMEEIAGLARAAINKEIAHLTGGEVKTVGANAALLNWLRNRGFTGDDLRKETVAEWLSPAGDKIWSLAQPARRVLALRQEGAKTSLAKLPAMKLASGHGLGYLQAYPLVRGMLQYYGAFRTGRWAGRLIQLQNMPRPSISKAQVDEAIKIILGGCRDPEMLELLFGVSVMELLSSLLRSVLVARPGHLLAVADFSQIEARVLPWLAGEEKILDVFRSGKDVYVASAADVYGVPMADVTSDMRQIGKVSTLALGFGGGKGAFQTMAAAYNVAVDDDRAEGIKDAWRRANPKIVKFWKDLEAAFIRCVQGSGTPICVGFLLVSRWRNHVLIKLPGGRHLVYRDVQMGVGAFGNPCGTYMGMDQYTRKWKRLDTYGGKLAENVTQAVARDCMAEVMLAAAAQGIELILTVHDELLADSRRPGSALAAMQALMATPPTWAPGLPTGSDGWVGKRYRK